MNNNLENSGHEEIIIKIDLEEVFHGRQKHCEDRDPGTIIYYVFKVDKETFEKREYEFSGKDLLGLVGLTPEKYRLFQLGEGHKEILPHEVVDLRACGIERFKSVAKHANEGKEAAPAASPSLRNDFQLLEEDEKYLNRHFKIWESLKVGNTGWVIINDFELPLGYNVKETTLAIMVPPSYPSVEFDMMYFYPALHRHDGNPIGALSHQSLDGKTFQRWSRHRQPGDWRPGIDNLESHVLSIKGWLADELKKR